MVARAKDTMVLAEVVAVATPQSHTMAPYAWVAVVTETLATVASALDTMEATVAAPLAGARVAKI